MVCSLHDCDSAPPYPATSSTRVVGPISKMVYTDKLTLTDLMSMNKSILLILLSISTSTISSFGQNNFSNSPDSVTFYTVDIINFWRVFDKTEPKFDADLFENEYIAIGSKGLKGLYRIELRVGRISVKQ